MPSEILSRIGSYDQRGAGGLRYVETYNSREGVAVTRAEVSIQSCVACGSERWVATERWQSYQLATCSNAASPLR